MTEEDTQRISLKVLQTIKSEVDAAGGTISDAIDMMVTVLAQMHAAQAVRFNISSMDGENGCVDRIRSHYALFYGQLNARKVELKPVGKS